MPKDEAPSERLDSWKDIAAYLQRDVSTVQRWEKREGMPVHRHVHGKLGSVYAFKAEVDAWWQGRSVRLATDADVPSARARVPRWLAPAGMIAAGLLVTVLLVVRPFDRTEDRTGDVARARVNPEAYDLLLRARYLSVRTTDIDNQNAIALLERAIKLDQSFAAAYAELASAYATRLAYVKPDETRELEEKAFSTAEKALSLDPNVPEAYLARGDLLWTHSHKFAHERAVNEFRKALSLNPNSDQAHRRLARVFVHLGFFEEALRHADRSLAINPSNAQALNSRAQALLWSGKDEEALAILQSIPGPVLPELVEANTVFAFLRLNKREDAWANLRAALDKYPADPNGTLRGMEAMLVADSDPSRARELIESLRQRKTANPSHHAAYFAGCALARMRSAAEAVQWLREAAATGFPCYSLFARDPNLDPVRQDAGFQAFMTDLQKSSAALRQTLFARP